MSKVNDIKKQMGYQPKPVFEICSKCKHIRIDKVAAPWNKNVILEKNVRCVLGGFAVKKQGTCDEHEFLIDAKGDTNV